MIEDRKEYNKEYYKNNTDKFKLSRQKYYHKNKEKIKAYTKRWQKKNPDKVRGYMEKYKTKYPERFKIYKAKNKLYKKNKDYNKLPSRIAYYNNSICRSKLTKNISQYYYKKNKDKIQKLVDLITTHDLEIKKEE